MRSITNTHIFFFLGIALLANHSVATAQSTTGSQPNEERVFYFGFDLGPKYDHYTVRQTGGPDYSPNIKIIKDIGATAGISGGFLIDNKYVVELGIYRNNYKAKLEFISPQGNIFFDNTVVNTFSSYSIPVKVGSRFSDHSRTSLFYVQVGVTTLLNATLDFDQPKNSVLDQKTVDDVPVDQMEYVIWNNLLDGKIMTMDATLVWNRALRKNLFFSTSLSARFGIGGENRFTTVHHTRNEDNTEDVRDVTNEISTSGTGLNLTVGFRYFMFEE